MCSLCNEGWVFDTTIMGGPTGGTVKGRIHPVSAEWEDGYSRPSTGSIVVATRDPSAEDVWSGATGLYISQVLPDGTRLPRFGGYIESFNGSAGGATTLGIKSVDSFLEERLIAGPADPYTLWAYRDDPPDTQVAIELYKPTGPTTDTRILGPDITDGGTAAVAAFLVLLAQGNMLGDELVGLGELTATFEAPFSPLAGASGVDPFVYYNWWDFKNIGQAIRELVEAEAGVKYRLDHSYFNGVWSSVMVFSDVIGVERDYILKSDRELWQYALQVDASEKATRVYGVGLGDGGDSLFSIAYDADGIDNLPERQATVAWKDQANANALDAQTAGYVTDHRDPTTIPSGTIVGLPDYDSDAAGYDPAKGFPAPEICRPGDTFGVEIGYGVITVEDIRVRNLGVAWSLKEGAPVERTIGMQPVIRANESVRTQVPARVPTAELPVTQTEQVTADPWPQRGKLTNVTSGALTEISGMEESIKNPGHVWVHNDEQVNPQVHLVSLKDGHTAATFTPNPGVSAAPVGDPESIRISRVSGKLVLADTGDNDLDRPTSGVNQPHLLSVIEPKGAGNKGTIAATKYPIAYPGGQRVNCETLLIHPTTDVVYLVSKEATRARVFSFGPLSAMSTSNNVGTLVATLNIKNVSDGTHTYKGGFILLLNGTTKVPVLKSDFSYAGAQLTIPAMTKAEAIAVRDACSFVVTTETKSSGGGQAPIYQELIPTQFGATCTTPAGPTGTGTGTTTGNPNATVPGQLIPMNNWKLQLPI